MKTEFGGFDHGAQFFTVTDERFKAALALQPELIAQWQVPTVRVLDTLGKTLTSASPAEASPVLIAPRCQRSSEAAPVAISSALLRRPSPVVVQVTSRNWCR